MAVNEAMNKIKKAPMPANEKSATDRYAPNGPPRFTTESDSEATDEKLGSRAE